MTLAELLAYRVPTELTDGSRQPARAEAMRDEANRGEGGMLSDYYDPWLIDEWLGVHSVERRYRPSPDLLARVRAAQPIQIWRATDRERTIFPGAYVTTSQAYAADHGRNILRGPHHVLGATVYPDELYAVNPLEFWFVPRDITAWHRSQIEDAMARGESLPATVLAEYEAGTRRSNPKETDPIVLWHGSRAWSGPPEVRPAKGSRVEHGPGLYLTTSYETARRYARGGGSVMRFEIDPDIRWLENESLPLADAERFLVGRPRLRKRDETIADLRRVAARMTARLGGDRVPAAALLNLMVNYESLTGDHGPALAEFLVSHGIGASLANELSGEDWVLLFDPRKIRSYRKVPAGEVDPLTADAPLVRTRVRQATVRTNPGDQVAVYAYHLTTSCAMDSIRAHGLHPQVHPWHRDRGPLLFFGNIHEALRYLPDREFPVLLRFPWPRDAELLGPGDWVSRRVIPPEQVEEYEGPGSRDADELFVIHDEEERYDLAGEIAGRIATGAARSSWWRVCARTNPTHRPSVQHPVPAWALDDAGVRARARSMDSTWDNKATVVAFVARAREIVAARETRVFRLIAVPRDESPAHAVRFHSLGYAWSSRPEGCGVYADWLDFDGPARLVFLAGRVAPSAIDWDETLYAMMNWPWQWEINLLESQRVVLDAVWASPATPAYDYHAHHFSVVPSDYGAVVRHSWTLASSPPGWTVVAHPPEGTSGTPRPNPTHAPAPVESVHSLDPLSMRVYHGVKTPGHEVALYALHDETSPLPLPGEVLRLGHATRSGLLARLRGQRLVALAYADRSPWSPHEHHALLVVRHSTADHDGRQVPLLLVERTTTVPNPDKKWWGTLLLVATLLPLVPPL